MKSIISECSKCPDFKKSSGFAKIIQLIIKLATFEKFWEQFMLVGFTSKLQLVSYLIKFASLVLLFITVLWNYLYCVNAE